MRYVYAFVAILVLSAISFLAIAAGSDGAPIALPDAIQRLRPGIRRHLAVSVLDADTTTSFISATAGGSVPACYPDRGTLVTRMHGKGTCCLVLAVTTASSTITLGSQADDTAAELTDTAGPDGNGACEMFPASGGDWAQTIDVASLRTNFGARRGVCSGFAASSDAITGFLVRPPCNLDADCEAAGVPGGTCDTSPTQAAIDQSCAFMICKAASSGTFVSVGFEY